MARHLVIAAWLQEGEHANEVIDDVIKQLKLNDTYGSIVSFDLDDVLNDGVVDELNERFDTDVRDKTQQEIADGQ